VARVTSDEAAAIAVEAYHEHYARCPVCRKRCGCPRCRKVPANLCPRGKVLCEVATMRRIGPDEHDD
jgi:hypothetical protein